jgi:hypothetical protein
VAGLEARCAAVLRLAGGDFRVGALFAGVALAFFAGTGVLRAAWLAFARLAVFGFFFSAIIAPSCSPAGPCICALGRNCKR